MMVNYGVSAEVSVGDLFITGFFPGILLTVVFSAYAIIHGKKHKLYLPADKRVKKSIKYRLKVFLESIPALLMPVIILGGIYGPWL